MTAEELAEVLKAIGDLRPQQTMNFYAPIGQQIAHVDKIEAHFDKDMTMHVVGADDVVQDSTEAERVTNELTCEVIFTDPRGITEPGDMWLLMVAAEAWKVQFDNLPKFLDWAFEMFDVPFDKDECKAKLQTKMRNMCWSGINSQKSMLEFIKGFRSQENVRKSDSVKANAIYVAIKGMIRG